MKKKTRTSTVITLIRLAFLALFVVLIIIDKVVLWLALFVCQPGC